MSKLLSESDLCLHMCIPLPQICLCSGLIVQIRSDMQHACRFIRWPLDSRVGCMQPWQPLFGASFRWLSAIAAFAPALLFADALSIASSAAALADALGISWVASRSPSILVCHAYLNSIANFGCLCIVQMRLMVQRAMTIAQFISVS